MEFDERLKTVWHSFFFFVCFFVSLFVSKEKFCVLDVRYQ